MAIHVREWLAETRETMAKDALQGLQLGAYYLFVGLWLTVSTRVRFGTPIYERDWDLLVVLDACRTDALSAVADEYDFLEDRQAVWSVGSTTGEWTSHTFDRSYADEIGRTAYVTANPHSEEVLRRRVTPPQYVSTPATWPAWDPVEPDAFQVLEEVWRYALNDRLNVVPPRPVTDRAVSVARDTDADRTIVHYMQPHAPYVADAIDVESPLPEASATPFDRLLRGEVDRASVWAEYLDNLRLVLDEVAILLENVDAEKAVITADHGEAFGEWGFYEHPIGCPHPVVRRVPWVETTGVDRGTRMPEPPEPVVTDEPSADVAAQLRDLGYR